MGGQVRYCLSSTKSIQGECADWRVVGYKIIKIREPVSQRMGLLFTVSLPEIKTGEQPRRRFMSAFEQRREVPNRAFQYLVVSASRPSNRIYSSPDLIYSLLGGALTVRWVAGSGTIRDYSVCDPSEGYGGPRGGQRVGLGALGSG